MWHSYVDSLIYIPLWLDLLSIFFVLHPILLDNLHSTMVRFIISPLSLSVSKPNNLHSTMVRFIMDQNMEKMEKEI